MSAFGVKLLSDNLNPFQRWRGGKYKLCTYGAGMAKSRWAGIPSYAKTTDLSGSIFSSPIPEKKPTQYSLLQQLPRKTVDRWYGHGHSQVSSSLVAHLEVRLPTPYKQGLRACLHEGRGPQVGEVTCGGLPHLTCKRDHIKMRDYMDRRAMQPKRVTSPIRGYPTSM